MKSISEWVWHVMEVAHNAGSGALIDLAPRHMRAMVKCERVVECHSRTLCGSTSVGFMTSAEDDPDRKQAEDDPDRKQKAQATEALASAVEPPTRVQQAGAGIAEAQAWKGQQVAKGWRKLVNALRPH